MADVSEPSIGSIFMAHEDGTDRGLRNVGFQNQDVGELPKKTYYVLNTAKA